MKKILIFTTLLYLLLSCFAWAEETGLSRESIILNQMDELNTNELQGIMDEINRDIREYFPDINFRQFVMQLLKGETAFSLSDVLSGSLKYLFNEVVASWKLVAQILILSSICAVLTNLQSAFENEAVGKLAHTVCYLIIVSISVKSFMIAMIIGREAIDAMVTFMQVIIPMLLALLLSIGGITTSAFLQPLLLGAIGLMANLIKNIIMPLILFSAVLSVVNNLSANIQVTKLAGLLKQASVIALGFILTAFAGIITIQGITASTVDGITIRTAKFAVDRFVPIVGGFLSDAVDTVIGCSLILKNAIGAVGLIIVFLICLSPLVKILALIIIYKLCAAVIEPISQSTIVNCLNSMSNSLVILFASVCSIAVMFFITIAVIVATGNITVMMR